MVKHGRFYDGVTGQCLGVDVKVMRYFPQRLVGMLYLTQPLAAVAFWFPRCRAVHTWGMHFAIRVIGLDAQHKVVAILPRVPPGQVVRIAGVDSIFECGADVPFSCAITVGQQLQFRWSDHACEI